jgi:GGDEF domain-containing protein
MTGRRVFFAGADPGLSAALRSAVGADLQPGPPSDLRQGDVVVIDAAGPGNGLPGGNAFSSARAFKERRGVAVFVVIAADDMYGTGIARFCLADGVLVWHPRKGLQGSEQLGGGPAQRPRRSVDELLRKAEAALQADGSRAVSALQRLLHWERQDTLLHRLQDPETGLFDGPYASLKLDEEFKRATRMHLPLCLILLDMAVAPAALPPQGPDRRELLAEVASVFLNECRDIDVLSRFTETTFLFLLPGTGADGGTILARRMIRALRERPFASGVRLDPRAGLVAIPATGIADRRAFVAIAEACLERALAGSGDGGVCSSWE